MKRKHKTSKSICLKDVYQDLVELQSIYKIEHEALWLCYDEDKDYLHIFSLGEILSRKLQTIILNIKTILNI